MRTSEHDAANTPTSTIVRRVFIVVSVAAVVFVAWAARDELRDAAGVVRDIPPAALAAGLALEAGAVAALAQVYRASVAATGHGIGYAQGLQVSMGAFTLSRVLPGGGAAGAVWAAGRLRRFGLPTAAAGAAVVVEGLLAMVTLGAIVVVGAGAALFRGRVTAAAVIAVCVVPVLFAAAAWGVAAAMRSDSLRASVFSAIRRVLPRRSRLADVWEAAAGDLAAAMRSRTGVLPVIGWSALNWLLDVAALWVVFFGLGLRLEIGVLILGFGVANLVTALPHTPGGLGLVEAGMTGAFVALGVDTAVALAAVLVYRLVSFWIPVLVGVPQYLRPAAGVST